MRVEIDTPIPTFGNQLNEFVFNQQLKLFPLFLLFLGPLVKPMDIIRKLHIKDNGYRLTPCEFTSNQNILFLLHIDLMGLVENGKNLSGHQIVRAEDKTSGLLVFFVFSAGLASLCTKYRYYSLSAPHW